MRHGPLAPPAAPVFARVLEQRFSRRDILTGTAAAAGTLTLWPAAAEASAARPGVFSPVPPQRTDALVLSRGYAYDVLARWGDRLFPDTPALTDRELTGNALLQAGGAERQARLFGTNCDGLAFFPARGARGSRGVLCVNHEYALAGLTFAGVRGTGSRPEADGRSWVERHPAAVAVMQAAQGVSVIEVARRRGRWQLLPGAPLTRRVTATTPCEIAGPARGAALLRTSADPHGTRALGTFANCASGKTPWGTYLTAEENIDDYFGGTRTWARTDEDDATREAHRRFPLRERSLHGWERVEARFDLAREPREALRFGWIVEIDPHDPSAPPRKRTALGRFSHEGANTRLAHDGRVAVYMGDDDMFEYVYKFVTRRAFDPQSPAANRDLLDDGTLYVARFDADGTGEWLPLVHDERGPLNRRSGFASQADVVIRARAAADLLGATPMDRPEDIDTSPVTGRVYISCTNNAQRREGSVRGSWGGRELDLGPNAANPRPRNELGHIIELIEDADDAAATRFRWSVFLLAGDPRAPGATHLTRYEDVAAAAPGDTFFAGAPAAGASPFACPDNLGFDPTGRLWIVTDADDDAPGNNGCFVCPTTGPQRGALQQLASGPIGAELCGCEFTPDGTTLFLSVQHPGAGGSLDAPVSHWPDGGNAPPRSALVAVRREDGDPL